MPRRLNVSVAFLLRMCRASKPPELLASGVFVVHKGLLHGGRQQRYISNGFTKNEIKLMLSTLFLFMDINKSK